MPTTSRDGTTGARRNDRGTHSRRRLTPRACDVPLDVCRYHNDGRTQPGRSGVVTSQAVPGRPCRILRQLSDQLQEVLAAGVVRPARVAIDLGVHVRGKRRRRTAERPAIRKLRPTVLSDDSFDVCPLRLRTWVSWVASSSSPLTGAVWRLPSTQLLLTFDIRTTRSTPVRRWFDTVCHLSVGRSLWP